MFPQVFICFWGERTWIGLAYGELLIGVWPTSIESFIDPFGLETSILGLTRPSDILELVLEFLKAKKRKILENTVLLDLSDILPTTSLNLSIPMTMRWFCFAKNGLCLDCVCRYPRPTDLFSSLRQAKAALIRLLSLFLSLSSQWIPSNFFF